MNWGEWIQRAEEWLEGLTLAKKLLIALAIFGLIGGMGYYFVLEERFEKLAQTKMELEKVERSLIKQDPKRLESRITRIKREIMTLQTKLEELKQKKYSIIEDLEKKRNYFLSQKSLSALLQYMLADSYKKGLQLQELIIYDTSIPFLGKIEQTKRIDVKGKGSFLSLVRYLRNIEDYPLLLKVDHLVVETNGSMPQFSFILRLYGAKG